mmetsp:Transcript_8256/g.12381  ORF Transcript_8256/g.12381 Transcript_8256/m.12381 type:complete len:159 (+) Transcript_8256:128-604(+)
MASSNDHTKIMITVPTKKHDGGSDSESAALIAAAPKPRVDAFTKYSSNLIRMKELLLLGDNNEHDEEGSLDYLASLNDALRYASKSDQVDRNNHGNVSILKRRKGNNSRRITQAQQGQGFLERKTRISYELHPSLLLHDLIDLNASAYIPDDEDESEG